MIFFKSSKSIMFKTRYDVQKYNLQIYQKSIFKKSLTFSLYSSRYFTHPLWIFRILNHKERKAYVQNHKDYCLCVSNPQHSWGRDFLI